MDSVLTYYFYASSGVPNFCRPIVADICGIRNEGRGFESHAAHQSSETKSFQERLRGLNALSTVTICRGNSVRLAAVNSRGARIGSYGEAES
jgi:hypothetical protein